MYKYIKYKNKYNQLKNLIGGAHKKIIEYLINKYLEQLSSKIHTDTSIVDFLETYKIDIHSDEGKIYNRYYREIVNIFNNFIGEDFYKYKFEFTSGFREELENKIDILFKQQVKLQQPDIERKVPDKKVFSIFTTGIADWCNLETILPYFYNTLLPHIKKIIGNDYNIEIIHSDILQGGNELVEMNKAKKDKCIKDIILMINKETKGNVIRNEFTHESLNFSGIPKENSLLLDFAHIFLYTSKPGSVLSSIDNKVYEIPCLRFGYVGEWKDYKDHNFNTIPYHILPNKFHLFEINHQSGKVTTFIDKLIRLGYINKEPMHEPVDIFNNYLVLLQKTGFPIFKKLNDKLDGIALIYDKVIMKLKYVLLDIMIEEIMINNTKKVDFEEKLFVIFEKLLAKENELLKK